MLGGLIGVMSGGLGVNIMIIKIIITIITIIMIIIVINDNIYTHTYTSLSTHIYIYMERERERNIKREREREICTLTIRQFLSSSLPPFCQLTGIGRIRNTIFLNNIRVMYLYNDNSKLNMISVLIQ